MRIPCMSVMLLTMAGMVASAAPYPWDLVPADNEVPSWTRKDTTKYKIWQDPAHPGDSLYDFIDGGNGTYESRGFVNGAMLTYTDQAKDITVNLYNQGVADSALSLYSSSQISGLCTQPVNGLGDAACISEALFMNTMYVIEGQYYMEIGFEKTIEAQNAAVALAEAAIGKISSGIIKIEMNFMNGNVGPAMTCYPNPISSGDIVKIKLSGGTSSELKIFDVAGHIVKQTGIRGNSSFFWSTDNYPAGIYIIQLTGENGSLATKLNLIK